MNETKLAKRSDVTTTRRLAESAILLALGTVLSIWPKIQMPMGGGLTICSMLPLVIISYRHGCKWGAFSALAYSILQCLLGMKNVMYGRNAMEIILIAALDYIVAYLVIGFAGMFKNKIKDQGLAMVAGIVVTFIARFACHFFSGWLIWDAMWPNEYHMAAPVYSLVYNGAYMLPEIVITAVVAYVITRFLDFDTLKRPIRAK